MLTGAPLLNRKSYIGLKEYWVPSVPVAVQITSSRRVLVSIISLVKARNCLRLSVSRLNLSASTNLKASPGNIAVIAVAGAGLFAIS